MKLCTWCKRPVESRRRDATTCSKSCRQAQWRFRRAVGVAPGSSDTSPVDARRIAYADPPYPGLSRRYYAGHPDYAGEVDHQALIESLSDGFDTWALSTSARALPEVLALCPPGARVACWVRNARPHATARLPLNAWEPLIYVNPRPVAQDLHDTSRVDVLTLGVTARRTDPARVIGAKPAGFARWMFHLLGARPHDEFVDVFPGSGGIQRAWVEFAGVRDTSRTDPGATR